MKKWTIDDLRHAIDFAAKRGGDCSLLVLYVAERILAEEKTPENCKDVCDAHGKVVARAYYGYFPFPVPDKERCMQLAELEGDATVSAGTLEGVSPLARPEFPLSSIIRENDINPARCECCGSSMTTGFIGLRLTSGCIQPDCPNYWKKRKP